jgi:hypothetical protein
MKRYKKIASLALVAISTITICSCSPEPIEQLAGIVVGKKKIAKTYKKTLIIDNKRTIINVQRDPRWILIIRKTLPEKTLYVEWDVNERAFKRAKLQKPIKLKSHEATGF